jgi:hypothetical protein
MTNIWIRRTFVLFHLMLGTVIFVESVLTVVHSLHSQTQSHLASLLPWFAGLEALAAVMLLVPQTIKVGGSLLLLIFLAALIVHGPAEQMPLFVYAAGVIFVMVHGSAYSAGAERSVERQVPED